MANVSAPNFGLDGSLVTLAAQRRLPRHQTMDVATLQWIKSNRPQNFPDTQVEHPPIKVARYAIVPSSWFAVSNQTDSIHGQRHGARVAILAAQLARVGDLPVKETLEAVIAAALHDCRRLHDQDDPGHGKRAASWFIERQENVIAHLPPEAKDVRRYAIAAAIELHDVPYSEFDDLQTRRYEATQSIADIVKTADALDRYRLPKLKWWPNSDHIRLIPPRWLHRYAFDLVLKTEGYRLGGLSSQRSIVDTLNEEKL
jgi:hypothetical protein